MPIPGMRRLGLTVSRCGFLSQRLAHVKRRRPETACDLRAVSFVVQPTGDSRSPLLDSVDEVLEANAAEDHVGKDFRRRVLQHDVIAWLHQDPL